MRARLLISVLWVVVASGCATYRTDTEAEFDNTIVYDDPVIHVGDIPETPDQMTFLGWVEAEVTAISPFHANPTEEQVNVALALKGQEKGGHAVVFVTYREELFGMKMVARGQVVQLEDGQKYVHSLPPTPSRTRTRTVQYAEPEPKTAVAVGSVAVISANASDDSQTTSNDSSPAMPGDTPNSNSVSAAEASNKSAEAQQDSKAVSSASPKTKSALVSADVKSDAAMTEVQTVSACQGAQCGKKLEVLMLGTNGAVVAPSPQGIDKSTLYMMRSNAEFVRDNSKSNDIRQAAERILAMIHQQLTSMDHSGQIR
ncbi:Uncharacterised protein [BD1-7 clade bacterium]|uniref:Uncharacterized protein n=1 Tax=BD1-7 clade bacterium TaxID=2029982 RepID=A0A5S9QQ44_9GAMM|nr:Uncharacterised protein [BD1-7 clade bacterium]CAA0120698.1 Uncharacterised protein [BD1-7 clade bacterium]